MKTTRTRHLLFTLGTLSLFSVAHSIRAQGTAFTYQGQLNSAGQPANGAYDLRFAIYDSTNDPGTVVAGPLTNSAMAVSNGVFTVALDFGAGVFNGADRWLEVAVRTNGGIAFTVLTPRQQVTASPYAVTAANVTGVIPGGSLSGIYSGPVTFNNGANVFAGALFAGTFNGNGTGVTGVNAATLGGVNAAGFWKLGGNAVAPGQFIGSTNNQPVELWAGGMRVLRLEPDSRPVPIAGNWIGGYTNNTIEQPGSGANVIAGGGFGAGVNIIHSNSSGVFIGAGSANEVGPNLNDAVIGGGFGNKVLSPNSVIGGGTANKVQTNSPLNFIGGGNGNLSSGYAGAIVGGVQNSALGNYDIIGGGVQNTIKTNAWYASIGGGGFNSIGTNSSSSTISGGYGHVIKEDTVDGAIGGGSYAIIGTNSPYSTIGGGRFNTVGNNATAATIAGGYQNTIQANAGYGAIGGGYLNTVLGNFAVIPGGYLNSAFGSNSLAAGKRAKANHDGAFVWGDSQEADFVSSGTNQFLIRAAGGVGINTNNPAGAALNVAGMVRATVFQGDGSGLTNVGSAGGNYIFSYDTSTQPVTTPGVFQDVNFSTDSLINGWTHTPGTATFTSSRSGLYLIQYSAEAMTTISGMSTVSIRAVLNGSEVAGSQAVVDPDTASQMLPVSKSFIASINASDTIKLQFTGSNFNDRLLASVSMGTTRPSVSMTITRIQ